MGLHGVPRAFEPGDTFEGGTVVRVDQVLRFLVVSTDKPQEFFLRASAREDVRYVEEDRYEQWIQVTPNDPRYSNQYGPQQMRVPEVWDASFGSTDKIVCVVDTGIRHTHEDLAGTRYLGGYDYVNNDNDPWDDQGHGTHVSGTAAATIHNGKGVAGMGNVGHMAVKVLNSGGSGYLSDVASGIRWCPDNGAHVVSLSLGASSGASSLQDAVDHAWNSGALVVAAAGNDGPCSDCISYPAAYANAIAVTCVTSSKGKCSFSSSGAQAELAAAGYGVDSTTYSSDTSYGSKSGTSMSTPHVSGVATLLWSLAPTLTNAELRQLLQDTAQDLGSSGRDHDYGYGIPDAKAIYDLTRVVEPDKVLYSEDFDAGTVANGTLTGLWHVTDACATPPSPPNYLGYHRTTACDYDTGLSGNSGTATIDIDLSDAIFSTLKFKHRWETEGGGGSVDVRSIHISTDGGASWTTLRSWNAGPSQTAWTDFEISLNSFVGSAAKLRFKFDSVDNLLNTYFGWHIDDLEVLIADNYPPVADAGPDQTVGDSDGDGYASVTLDGTASSDEDGNITAAEWTLDGTVVATGLTANATLPVGVNEVNLTVTDDDNATATDAVVVTVNPNTPPVADAGPDFEVGDGDDDGYADVPLDGSASSDADGTLTAFEWLWNGSVIATGATATVNLSVGSHALTLRVTDDGGESATDDVTVTVNPNAPPVADFSAVCSGESCAFDASSSSDPEDTALTYAWDFGDGSTGTGLAPTHTYASGGTYDVTLTVEDVAGLTDTLVKTVDTALTEVVNEDFDDGSADGFTLSGLWRVTDLCATPPSAPNYLGYHKSGSCSYATGYRTYGAATFTADLTLAQTDSVITFRFSHRWVTESDSWSNTDDSQRVQVSTDGAEWTTLREWNCRDANQLEWVTEEVNLSAYAGSEVRLRFYFDSSDSYYNSYEGWHVDDVTVTYTSPTQPVANPGPDQVVSDGDGDGAVNVTLDGSASYDPDGTLVSHVWTQDGATLASTAVANVTLPVGSHTITLTVQDDDNNTDAASTTVTVNPNAPPVARAGPDLTARDSDGDGVETLPFDGSASSDEDGTIVSHEWLWNGSVVSTSAVTTLDLPVGSHTVTLRVTDNGNATATDDVTAIVEPNALPTARAGADQTARDSDGTGEESFTLDGSASSDEDGTIASYEWIEDGTVLATEASPTLAFSVGSHVVTLRVTDNGGGTATDDVTLVVEPNAPPTAVAPANVTVSDADGDGSETMTLEDAGSADPDGIIVSHEWIEDGTVLATGSVATLPFSVGSHVVTLRVTDHGGATDSSDVIVTVNANTPPVAAANVTCTGRVCTFNGTASRDAENGLVSAFWEFGDGNTSAALRVVHRYPQDGAFAWRLTVSDQAQATAEVTGVVNVEAEPPRGPPAAPPERVQVEDRSALDAGENAPVTNVESAWFTADYNNLYVGLKVEDLPEDPRSATAVRYAVSFQPRWALDDHTWGGRFPGGVQFHTLVVTASHGEVVDTLGQPLPRFTLSGITFDGQSHVVDEVDGAFEATADIVWWIVPRTLLQDPAEGEELRLPIARTEAAMESLFGTRFHETDTTGHGEPFTLAYTERVEQFEAVYSFETSDEGFTVESDYLRVDARWVPGRILVVMDRTFSDDEIISKPLEEPFTPESSFRVAADWLPIRVEDWQGASPLFLGAADVTSPRTDANTVTLHYESRDHSSTGQVVYRVTYRDATGALRLEHEARAPASHQVELVVEYDATTRELRTFVHNARGVVVGSGSYVIGSNPGDGFAFEKMGVASDGGNVNSRPYGAGEVDEIRVYRILRSGA